MTPLPFRRTVQAIAQRLTVCATGIMLVTSAGEIYAYSPAGNTSVATGIAETDLAPLIGETRTLSVSGSGPDESLQKDCVLPLSRGGRYRVENVVPACRSCNASKSNDEVTGWLRRKRLDEPRFLLRWAEIAAVLRTGS